jgi:hypothetical protein
MVETETPYRKLTIKILKIKQNCMEQRINMVYLFIIFLTTLSVFYYMM